MRRAEWVRRGGCWIVLCVAAGVGLSALQAPATPAVPPRPSTSRAAPAAPGITNQDVISMTAAGLADDVIIGAIRQASSRRFTLTPAGLIALKTGKVSDAVIRVMQGGEPEPARDRPVAAPSAVVAVPPPAAAPVSADVSRSVKAGTSVRLRTPNGVSSKDVKKGDVVALVVAEDVSVDGQVVFREGAPARAIVAQVTPRSLTRLASLELTLESAQGVSGETVALRAAQPTNAAGGLSVAGGSARAGTEFAAAVRDDVRFAGMKDVDDDAPSGRAAVSAPVMASASQDSQAAGNGQARSSGVGALAGTTPLSSAARDRAQKDLQTRFLGKQLIAKVTFPAWKDGLDVKTDGTWDLKWVTRQIKDHGVGIEVGDKAAITDLKVKERWIEVHLNGGGFGTFGDALLTSSSKKRAREGAGGKVPGGSRINIRFDHVLTEIDVEDLTRLVSYLEPVVDTSPLMQVVHQEDIPAEFKDAAAKKLVVVGMDKATVFAIMGEPKSRNVDLAGDSPLEKWQFELSTLKTRVVTFKDGRVSRVDEF